MWGDNVELSIGSVDIVFNEPSLLITDTSMDSIIGPVVPSLHLQTPPSPYIKDSFEVSRLLELSLPGSVDESNVSDVWGPVEARRRLWSEVQELSCGLGDVEL